MAVHWAGCFEEERGALVATEMGGTGDAAGKLSETIAAGTDAINAGNTNTVAGVVQFPIRNFAIRWAGLGVARLPLVEIKVAVEMFEGLFVCDGNVLFNTTRLATERGLSF